MKKFIILAAALIGLAACNEDPQYGPEYSTSAEVSEPSFLGEISASTDITSDEDVIVTSRITSEYGLHSAWIVFLLNDDSQTAAKASVWTNPAPYTKDFVHLYSGKIPAQKAGTKVTFMLVTYTPYGVPFITNSKEYTVIAAEEPQE